MPNPTIEQITLPTGSTYDIVDAGAREMIEGLSGFTKFLGVTTTALYDGSTANPITIDDESVTADNGSIATYGSKEFIFNGTAWQEFGDLSALGTLAYKNSVAVSTTATGTVSKPTFTGSSSTVTITATDDTNGNYQPKGTVSKPTFTGSSSTVTITATDNTSGNYQPKGTVSQPTFTGSAMTSTGSFTPAGSIELTNTNKTATVSAASSGTATYTPAGSNTASTVSGSCSVTATGTISTGTGTANYTPAGSVAAPTISVATAGTTTTIKNPTSKTVVTDMSVAAPSATQATGELVYCSVSNKVLTLSKFVESTGASISTSNVTVKTGDAAYSASAPAFTGTGAELKFTGTAASGTIIGTAAAQKFTGTGARLVTGNISVPSSAAFTGTEGSVSVSGTPAGSVSQPTFTGTKTQLAGTTTAAGSVSQPTFTGTKTQLTGTTTAAGSVSQPTFTGNTVSGVVTYSPS